MDEPMLAFDSNQLCPTCNLKTLHKFRVYKDATYTTCTKCGRHVKVIYEGNKMVGIEIDNPDKTKDEYDFKRNADRHYKSRKENEDE